MNNLRFWHHCAKKNATESDHPCVVSAPAICIHSNTINSIIIRQIQHQRFFSFSSPLRSSNEKSLDFSVTEIFGKCQNIYCGQFWDLWARFWQGILYVKTLAGKKCNWEASSVWYYYSSVSKVLWHTIHRYFLVYIVRTQQVTTINSQIW